MSDADIIGKPVQAVDTECYSNFWHCQFLDKRTGVSTQFDLHDGQPLDVRGLKDHLRLMKLVTFNGLHYDMPMIFYALKLERAGFDPLTMCKKLKAASDAIIIGGLKNWQFCDMFGVEISRKIDHIDLIEVAPGKASLKLYAGRMHTPTMEDLPYEPGDSITPEMRDHLRTYCTNDCRNTLMLFDELSKQIELREEMTEKYGMDLRSKSDAQIAEAVIKDAVCKSMGVTYIPKPEFDEGWSFRYVAPPGVAYSTPMLQETLAEIESLDFVLSDKGKPVMPAKLASKILKIGQGKYKMGMGGLHSQEKSQTLRSTNAVKVTDRDVTSYYPWIVIRNGLFPKQMGNHFARIYGDIVAERIKAKEKGDTVKADSLKITINGSFGKLGSRFSAMFAPDLLIQVTITGQLYLLMLIERLELSGIRVMSANTDGIVFLSPVARQDRTLEIIRQWESDTGMETEETVYSVLHSRDVNNYVAITVPDKNGKIKVKTKGVFASTGLMKNPNSPIIAKAAIEYLQHGTDVQKFIMASDDIRDFAKVITVKSGAYYEGNYLGKVVRFYKKGGTEPIRNAKGDQVQLSDGAAPMMRLPATMPKDIDYGWYIRETIDLIRETGEQYAGQTYYLFNGFF